MTLRQRIRALLEARLDEIDALGEGALARLETLRQRVRALLEARLDEIEGFDERVLARLETLGQRVGALLEARLDGIDAVGEGVLARLETLRQRAGVRVEARFRETDVLGKGALARFEAAAVSLFACASRLASARLMFSARAPWLASRRRRQRDRMRIEARFRKIDAFGQGALARFEAATQPGRAFVETRLGESEAFNKRRTAALRAAVRARRRVRRGSSRRD